MRFVSNSAGILFLVLCANCLLFSQNKGGRWQFENNGLDTAEWDLNDDSGELQNQASFSDIAPLQETMYYLWLDSSDVHDFLLIQDSDDLDFENENIGISAWIYPIVLNDVHYLVNKGDQFTTPKTTNYSLRIFNNKLEFLIRDAQNRARKVSSSFVVPENQWTFVAAFYDFNAGQVYMWNNLTSAPVDSLAFNQEILANDDPLAIGSWFRSDTTNSWKDFQGRIDDVRISSRKEDLFSDGLPSAVSTDSGIPFAFSLGQNYPNPFNPTTIITFEVRQQTPVTLKIYNLLGQPIATLVDQILTAGVHKKTVSGGEWATGFYFYRLQAGPYSETRKMLLQR